MSSLIKISRLTLPLCRRFSGSKPFFSDHIENYDPEQYVEFRRNSLKNVKDWYPNSNCQPTHRISKVLEQFSSLEKTESKREENLKICGRVSSIRYHGKNLCFLDVIDREERIQIKLSRADYPTSGDFDEAVDIVRRGDIVRFEGFPLRTKAGELSLSATSVEILAPCLRIMPKKNVKMRFRKRHVDFLVNPETRSIFLTRSKIIREIRSFLEEEEFVEVETPVLGTKFGGALARPFKSFHNDVRIIKI